MYDESIRLHNKIHGKLSIETKVKIETMKDLSLIYTPGVAGACLEIQEESCKAFDYTNKGNTVAVISNGTAVLGLGEIGALASIPVMEGKAALFKRFANVNAVPICINEKDPDKLIDIIEKISPCYGGINLEDISSPTCFYVEEALNKKLDIPVFHDDQHGTAIVVLAALFNALKVVEKEIGEIKVVLSGAGAAGFSIVKMLIEAGVKDIIVCDEYGSIYQGRNHLETHKKEISKMTNHKNIVSNLETVLKGADVFIGVSVKNIVTPSMVKSMNEKSIVFALANPEPEISYDLAKESGAKVVGTGRSDRPNQINNVLAFPGIFKGALMSRANEINAKMKVSAAKAIADTLEEDEINENCIIPDVFDAKVAENVSRAVSLAWEETLL